jgi:hypothetical protein
MNVLKIPRTLGVLCVVALAACDDDEVPLASDVVAETTPFDASGDGASDAGSDADDASAGDGNLRGHV